MRYCYHPVHQWLPEKSSYIHAMRQIGESYSTSSHMLHPTLVTMPRSENIQHLLFIVRTGFSKAKSANGRFAQTIQPSKWHCNEILAVTHKFPVNNLEFLVLLGIHIGSSFCNIKKGQSSQVKNITKTLKNSPHCSCSQKFLPDLARLLGRWKFGHRILPGKLIPKRWRLVALCVVFRLFHGSPE